MSRPPYGDKEYTNEDFCRERAMDTDQKLPEYEAHIDHVGGELRYGLSFKTNTDRARFLKAALQSTRKPDKCKCDIRTKLVGDGCQVCNPTYTVPRDVLQGVREALNMAHRDYVPLGKGKLQRQIMIEALHSIDAAMDGK